MSDRGGRAAMGWLIPIAIVLGLNGLSYLFNWGWYFF